MRTYHAPAYLRGVILARNRLAKEHIKLDTLPSEDKKRIWKIFNDFLNVFHRAGKLGCVLFQFHFEFSQKNKAHVMKCRQELNKAYTMAAEFRKRTWFGDEGRSKHAGKPGRDARIEWLRKSNIVLVASEELEHELFSTKLAPDQNPVRMPIRSWCTSPGIVYVRVHRRTGTERVLQATEMRRLATSVRSHDQLLSKEPTKIWVLWGTCHEDQAIQNISCLAAVMSDVAVDWPLRLRNSKSGIRAFFTGKSAKNTGTKNTDGAHFAKPRLLAPVARKSSLESPTITTGATSAPDVDTNPTNASSGCDRTTQVGPPELETQDISDNTETDSQPPSPTQDPSDSEGSEVRQLWPP